MVDNFLGREQELALLSGLQEKSTASMVVIYGRRRVGKTRLIEEFSKKFKAAYMFTGLHPRIGSSNEKQLSEFATQVQLDFKQDKPDYDDWSIAFHDLAQRTKKGKVLIVLDEITWMAAHDDDFLGKLKIAWDKYFKKNPQLVLVLCGSVSVWISKNILSSTGFHGRVSLKLKLKELPINLCAKFWGDRSSQLSAHEKLKILAVTGGIPKYLEEVRPNLSAEENIKQLCFMQSGLLYNDFSQIFIDILQKNSSYYYDIVTLLAHGSLDQKSMIEKLKVSGGGTFVEYIKELIEAGFISSYKTWNLQNHKVSNLREYRLTDNYLRFYLKYIQPNMEKISSGTFSYRELSSLPGWASIIALQVENLVLNNRHEVIKQLEINPGEIVCDNPYFERPTNRKKGCQVDYLIQTEFGGLYVCEVKFTRNTIKKDIIEEMQKKITAMTIPKNTAVSPVLIHMGDVHDDVYDARYFAKIINLEDLL